MRLWRLSTARHARSFDGGYGLANSGRWNTRGRPVTYCTTVPSLAALEKRVHVTDPGLLPPLVMVEYDAPDDLPRRTIAVSDLDPDWARLETETQAIGDEWLRSAAGVLLFVPSVVMPLPRTADCNVLVNHRHAAAAQIKPVSFTPFTLDPRLF
jgi:RES domain-containing protein